MATNPASYPMPPGLSACLDHAPLPMATVKGTTHTVCYVNAAFCRLVDKTGDELVGKPLIGMLAELTNVCRCWIVSISRENRKAT